MATPAVHWQRNQHSTMHACIVADGAQDVIDFATSVFGASVLCSMHAPDDETKYQHVSLKIGAAVVMVQDGIIPELPAIPSRLYVYVEDVDKVYEKALSAGAESVQKAMKDAVWGGRVAGVKDPAGNTWWIFAGAVAGAKSAEHELFCIPQEHSTVFASIVAADGADAVVDFATYVFDVHNLFMKRETKPGDNRLYLHAAVWIGDSVVLVEDATPEVSAIPTRLYAYVEDVDTSYEKALSQKGAESLHKPEDQFWGDRLAGVKDSAGNEWWIATHKYIANISECSGTHSHQ